MTDKAAEQEPIINEGAEQGSAQEEQTNEELEQEAGSEVNEEPMDEMQKLELELTEAKDKYLRLVAEFDNFRKRSAKERIDFMATANKDVVLSMLDVLDDCERAEQQMDKDSDAESIREGAKLVFHKLRNNLQQKGVTVMESMGKDFDPDLHEAITEIPAPEEKQVGKVLDVVQNGYYMNNKLIRHAKVVVGK
ncbi:MAG: nucleotide exchange factor GrpE [Chitinophagales bacterium]|nr:nucleotide exchange factor GrpE [Chitinophagaceae bacterium]MCB9065583.1 nucleotide exchange factor GrpE [Chitinophagales bacterium]